jgi:predicted ATPase/DNA-binding CsgD family transcriptional regulator
VGESATATLVGGMHGFPAALTSFIGRASQVRDVAGLMERYRLVTVTGPGGAGKTRLAGEVAKRVAARFADGAWLVELAPVADPAQVPALVAAALGVREQPGVPAADAVAQVLSRQQLLLVLDNCEHVIEAAAAVCGRLLSACDDVRILATSREPLHVAAEARYRLAPLTLPEPDHLADAGHTEAVALFVDRARQADVHFMLSADTTPAVARLVTRLDGMPLAIELAAARVEALSVDQLLDGLDNRFALLDGWDRLAAGRHRSLAAAVDWSYRLLDDQERRVFRLLSVFPGPFTLEGAKALVGDGAGPAVVHLVDCSLLVPPRPGPDGRSRYGLLDTMRAYGAGLLTEAAERHEAAAALAGYALRLAEEATAGLQAGSGEAAAARWLDAEDATMRQALAWAMDHDEEMALRLAVALAPWWFLRGRAAGEYPVLREAAERAAPGGDAWCAAQFWLGETALYVGDLTGSLGHFTAVKASVEDRGPSRALAECLGGRSVTLANLGRVDEAAEEGRRSLAVAREVGYPLGELILMADLDRRAGRLEDAAAHLQEAIQITARTGGWFELGNILHCCGYLCATTGRYADALTLWAAASSALPHGVETETVSWVSRHREAQREAREALGPDRARTAEERGAAMSRAAIVEYVLLLTAPSQEPASTPDPRAGLDQLSARERELVTLVAQGRTDAQIAAQLFISVRTVGSHLDRIRDKTGCRRRADLTRLALSAGLI